MKTATMIFKTEPETKAEIQKLAKKYRVSSSFILNQWTHQGIRNGIIPIEPWEPNEETIRAIEESRKEFKEGKMKTFKTANEAIQYLDRFKNKS